MQKQKSRLQLMDRAREVLVGSGNLLFCGYVLTVVVGQSIEFRNHSESIFFFGAFFFILTMSLTALFASLLILVNRRRKLALRLQRTAAVAGFILVPVLLANYITQGFSYAEARIATLFALLGIAFWMRWSRNIYAKN
ncbi:hypothetical protein [Armatimonas rosea]|uniref:Uncharacterized protein n=1 Tax=Armatimonas rosea TaxID=685828 RepID=A0A7W9WA50_ARMRO|nr:hypothetical protein [Armatimonas rosea]MBB6053971.1 hypothetical protein [Armatimonas rosea]